ncbi:RNA polymerase sigma factor [Bacillus toyonensis]|uniref:RNA polymerase sigma factor n=1 Tax=Bacillus toyonensis TaxID=155322 RepID=UPI00124E2F57|nr:sigma-70 family RNA polymerase sigma factor [Bacillus toyonensis]KAB2380219.1 sigma-70 family RNA polymerase sigma factor [Bacillus toyonensis]
MAKAITLPKLEAQLIQQELGRKQETIQRDPEVDKQLCLAYQEGSNEAGVALIYRYLDKLSYIYRFPTRCKNRGGIKCKIDITTSTTKEDKEDLSQEILYHFLELLLEYDQTQGELQGLIVGKLHLRVFKYFYEELVDIKFNEQELDDNYDMEEEMKEIFLEDKEAPEDIKLMYLALSELTENQRKIVDMHIVKGWSSKESARELGVSASYVRNQKVIALKKLRKLMEAI